VRKSSNVRAPAIPSGRRAAIAGGQCRRAIAATGRALTAAVLALTATLAVADVGVNKSFTPNSVSAGQTSTLTIVFLNPNPAAATATSVTDTLPANVIVASPANPTTTCGGTVTATPGAGAVALSGGTIPAAVGTTPGQCQFTVGVLSNTPGTYINTIPVDAVSSSEGGNTQAAQASLVATALANLTGTKAFAPTVVHGGGGATTMTITLTNANGVPITNGDGAVLGHLCAFGQDALPHHLALLHIHEDPLRDLVDGATATAADIIERGRADRHAWRIGPLGRGRQGRGRQGCGRH